jgi:hypothetical protein
MIRPTRRGSHTRRSEERTAGDRTRANRRSATGRGQATVVGVALLLVLTAASLAALTAGVGVVVESGAEAAAADRAADALADLDPRTVSARTTVPLGGGRLAVEPRTVRILDGSRRVGRYRADAVVYETGDRRVAFLLGTVVRGTGEDAVVQRPPPVTASDDTLVVSLPILDPAGAESASGSGAVTLRSDVDHRHRRIGAGDYRVAVETATPAAWEAVFADRGVDAYRSDFDDDGLPSVVARYPTVRGAHLVVHRIDLRLEVDA